jgi:rhodanese-related sulfurtransferase
MTEPDPASTVPQIKPADAARRHADGQITLIDVREPDEWAAGHIPGAVHTPLGDLDTTRLDTSRPLVAVCRSGNRSGKATQALTAAGLDVTNMTGGMHAWAAAGLPVTTDDGHPGRVA